MKKSIIALVGLLLMLTGCIGAGSMSKVIKSADIAHKHIKAEFSGWNAHFTYESWPSSATNPPVVIVR